MTDNGLTAHQARKLAKEHGVKLPRVGYEVCLRPGLWLVSTGHAKFGWFDSRETYPFRLRETRY